MRTILCTVIALLVSEIAQAGEIGWFVNGGLGITFREPEDEPPFDQLKLEYDDGTAINLQSGIRFEPGLMVRGSYTYTMYDSLTASGSVSIVEDIKQQEFRFGVFFAPPEQDVFGYRVGGGYEYIGEQDQGISGTYEQDGGFLEAAVLFDAGRVTFDLAATAMQLETDNGNDADGIEFHLGVTFHAGRADISLNARELALKKENEIDDEALEFTLSVGSAWGYPAVR